MASSGSVFGRRQHPVLHFCQRAADAPLNPAGERLLFLEALEFLDQVQLELSAQPRPEFKGNVFVGVRSAVPASPGDSADTVCFLIPGTDRQGEAIQSSLTSNSLESGGIKTRVVQPLPNSQEFHGVFISQPRFDQDAAALELCHHISQADVVLVSFGRETYFNALYRQAFIGNHGFPECDEIFACQRVSAFFVILVLGV